MNTSRHRLCTYLDVTFANLYETFENFYATFARTDEKLPWYDWQNVSKHIAYVADMFTDVAMCLHINVADMFTDVNDVRRRQ